MNPLNLESQNQDYFRGSSEFPNQNCRLVQGFVRYAWTYKQINRDYNLKYALLHIDTLFTLHNLYIDFFLRVFKVFLVQLEKWVKNVLVTNPKLKLILKIFLGHKILLLKTNFDYFRMKIVRIFFTNEFKCSGNVNNSENFLNILRCWHWYLNQIDTISLNFHWKFCWNRNMSKSL